MSGARRRMRQGNSEKRAKPPGVGDGAAQLGVLHLLPEIPRLELRVGEQLLRGGHRVAQHAAARHRLEELGLGDPGEELRDGLLHDVDLFLGHLLDVECAPVLLQQEHGGRALLRHPLHQRLVGLPPGLAAVDDEVQVAVLAGPEHPHLGAGDGAPGHEGAGPLLHRAVEVPEGMGVGEAPQHAGLGRHVHVLAPAGAPALGVGHQRRHGGVGAGPLIALRKRHPERRLVRIAGERHAAAHGHDLDVRGPVATVGAGQAEGGDGHQHGVGVGRADDVVAETDLFEPARPEGLQHEVRLLHEALEQRLPLRRLEVQRDAALAVVEGEPVEALLRMALAVEIRPDQPGGVPARTLHLDHVRAQVAQGLAAEEAQLVGEVQDTVGRQGSLFTLIHGTCTCTHNNWRISIPCSSTPASPPPPGAPG